MQGVWTTDHTRLDETGKIAAARVVQPDDQVSIITVNGIALRTPVATISVMGRATRGVRVVNLDSGDTIAAVARLAASVELSGDDLGSARTRRATKVTAGGIENGEENGADERVAPDTATYAVEAIADETDEIEIEDVETEDIDAEMTIAEDGEAADLI